MPALRIAAVQASYVLMDRDATIDRVAELTAAAARDGADLVVFPEVFVPGTPIWIDTQAIWDDDEEWFGLLADHAVVGTGSGGRSARRDRGGAPRCGWSSGSTSDPSTAPPSTTPCCTTRPTERWPGGTASSCRPAPSGPYGAWATGRRCASWTPAGAGSAA